MTTWDKAKDIFLCVVILANVALNLWQKDIDSLAAWLVCFFAWRAKMDASMKLEEWKEEGKIG